MKKMTALMLALVLLLCGCGAKSEPATEPTAVTTESTTDPATEPATVPTTEPPVYIHPLNGSELSEPFTGRIFASSVSNVRDALPHVSVNEADIFFESLVNGSVVRCLALFSDIETVEAIGSTRSTRPMLNDLAEHYDAVLVHAGGTSVALVDANNRDLDHFNVDSLTRQADDPLKTGTAYRDKEYKHGEHNLFVIGPGIKAYAESQGVQTEGLPERDYGFLFTEDGTPANGEPADTVTIRIKHNGIKKDTVMEYDAETGRYVYWQYGKMMVDQITEVPEAFRNVVTMMVPMSTIAYNYHVADFNAGGTGYYACGGKIIPITWTCSGDKEPFRFFTEDGQPLAFGAGNTYIAITSDMGEVTWKAAATDQ